MSAHDVETIVRLIDFHQNCKLVILKIEVISSYAICHSILELINHISIIRSHWFFRV